MGFAYFDVRARATFDNEHQPHVFAGRGTIGICVAVLFEIMITLVAFLEPRDAVRLFLAPGEAFVYVLGGLALPYYLCVNQVILESDRVAIVKQGKLSWSGSLSDLTGIWLGARSPGRAGLFVEYVIFQTPEWPHPRIGNADLPPAEYRRLKEALRVLRPQYPMLKWRDS